MALKIFPLAASTMFLGASALQGAAISSITESGGIISTITVDAEVYNAGDLVTGTSSGGGHPDTGVVELDGIEAADDLDLETAGGRNRNYDAWETINFGGGNYQDTNGDGYDFFVFERGGNDILTVQPIFTDDTVGVGITVATSGSGWGATGYTDSGGQQAFGAAFKITDLLDAGGVNLTNTSIIKGLRFSPPEGTNETGVDPSVIVAVVPEPAASGMLLFGSILLASRRSRKNG